MNRRKKLVEAMEYEKPAKMEVDTQPNSENTQPVTQNFGANIVSQPVQQIWGRLYAKRAEIKSLDLVDDQFLAGRDPKCNFVFTSTGFPKKSTLDKISKQHFSINFDSTDYSNPILLTDLSSNGTFLNDEKIGKNNKQIIQNNDIIAICQPVFKVFQFSDQRALDSKEYPADVTKKYFISKKLGQGACGVVRLVYNVRTCEPFAMKQVQKYALSSVHKPKSVQNPDRIMNEVRIMNRLEHPCIAKLHDIIDKENSIYMFLEYMRGGDLLSRIMDNQYLPEKLAKLFFYQICHAVKYLHENGVTHRDIKPDNILLADKEEETLLNISDFGLSKLVENGSNLKTVCGTPLYVAPEILENRSQNKTYSKKVDIWSLGVVLFTMLSGTLPFSDQYGSRAIDQIKKGKFEFRSKVWKFVSRDAKKLIIDMLMVNPDDRPSVEEVMKKPWMDDLGIVQRARQIMNIGESSLDSDIENVTLVSMTLSEEEDIEVKSPPKKKQRINS